MNNNQGKPLPIKLEFKPKAGSQQLQSNQPIPQIAAMNPGMRPINTQQPQPFLQQNQQQQPHQMTAQILTIQNNQVNPPLNTYQQSNNQLQGPRNNNISTVKVATINPPIPNQQSNMIPNKPTDTKTILQSEPIMKLKKFLEDNRNVAAEYKPIIREIEGNTQLIEEYVPFQYRNQNDIQSRFQVLGQCKQFIRVRGDGNCFYSSFIYQYLKVILCDQKNDNYINYLGEQLINLQLQLFLQDYTTMKFTQEESLQYIFAFNMICKNVRSEINRVEQLDQLFKGIEFGFYYLSVLIFRNLFHAIFQHQQKKNDDRIPYDLTQELLTWELECNCNELMILLISTALCLQINVYICERTGAKIEKYNENSNLPQINILFRAGHYQIAVP